VHRRRRRRRDGGHRALYVKGELTYTADATLDEAWSATKEAVERLEYRVKDSAKDAQTAKLVAEQADGTDVTIRLERKGEQVEFGIRVGVFGNEAQSQRIMDEIRGEL
jgi:hypothetical protein